MGARIRSVAAVVAGFIVASVVMTLVESINTRFLYPELAKLMEGAKDKESIRAEMASAPIGAWFVVFIGWVLASLVGGFLAGWIGRTTPVRYALILGAVLTLAGIANNLALPPPTWFWIPTLLAFLPAAYVGARLVPPPNQTA
jgi:hypothetical protein